MRGYRHLQDYIYYSELYDRMTIEDCARWDDTLTKAKKEIDPQADPEKEKVRIAGGLVSELGLYFKKGEHYAKKDETIQKWMEDDRLKDEKVKNAIDPKGVRCLGCSSLFTNCISRDLMTDASGKDEVLFMFECEKCHKRRAYWENGKRYRLHGGNNARFFCLHGL